MTHVFSKGTWVFDDQEIKLINLRIHMTGTHSFKYANILTDPK